MSASCNERIARPVSVPALTELRELSGASLQPVFDEQAETWRREFSWDCRASLEMCRRFVNQRALPGYGLVLQGHGVALASFVGDGSGHLTQICVAPDVRGTGIGYELIRQSISALNDRGAVRVSLTVTSANRHAANLYRRMGFQVLRRFPAIVWDGF